MTPSLIGPNHKPPAADPGRVAVYLDSADYSNLSSPKITPELARVRDELRELCRDRRVAFCFSSVALFESSPVQAKDSGFSAARIELAGELCGTNALASVDRIFKIEAKQIQTLSKSEESVHRSDGHWFPDVSDLLQPLSEMRAQIKGMMEEKIGAMQLNRAQRRAAAALTSRHGVLRGSALSGLSQASEAELAGLPLRQKDMAIIQRYMAGQATREAAEAALLSSLADLPTLAKWIRNGNDMSLRLAPILRKPAADFVAKAQAGLDQTLSARQAALRVNPQLDRQTDWNAMRAGLLRDFISKNASQSGAVLARSDDERETLCPGTSTTMTLLFAQFKKAILGGRPPIVASDFGDCLHAIYAPYVSIFRADKRTTPDLRPLVARWGTTVTQRVDDVPGLIKARLA
ncbi:hypothetical protein CMZ82_13025 [Lysobacteraceae bacterium NML93-0792]|nr:hypothetical protein CMZ82_13025 [Xanthomonadaceae bacterium NML93-0792]PBS15067.1 hypothetical protein CMZ81_13055 [Xanthomonadaceae bacterium NML93-0793]PBS17842.1 hypothetical protein CMZ80_14730 [Xanthomonadaceae bacterium NML93-0831]